MSINFKHTLSNQFVVMLLLYCTSVNIYIYIYNYQQAKSYSSVIVSYYFAYITEKATGVICIVDISAKHPYSHLYKMLSIFYLDLSFGLYKCYYQKKPTGHVC